MPPDFELTSEVLWPTNSTTLICPPAKRAEMCQCSTGSCTDNSCSNYAMMGELTAYNVQNTPQPTTVLRPSNQTSPWHARKRRGVRVRVSHRDRLPQQQDLKEAVVPTHNLSHPKQGPWSLCTQGDPQGLLYNRVLRRGNWREGSVGKVPQLQGRTNAVHPPTDQGCLH